MHGINPTSIKTDGAFIKAGDKYVKANNIESYSRLNNGKLSLISISNNRYQIDEEDAEKIIQKLNVIA